MKLVTRADNLLLATLWQQMLQSAGIECEIRNRYIGAAVGELPADQVAPQIWVRNDADAAKAGELLAEFRQPRTSAPWCCFGCGERVEGQFTACWNCGAPRPD